MTILRNESGAPVACLPVRCQCLVATTAGWCRSLQGSELLLFHDDALWPLGSSLRYCWNAAIAFALCPDC